MPAYVASQTHCWILYFVPYITIPVYVSVHLGYVNMYTCVSQNIMHFLCVTIWLWILLVLYCDIFFTSIVCAALFSNIKLHLFHCNGLVLYCITHLSHRFVLMLISTESQTLCRHKLARHSPRLYTRYTLYIIYIYIYVTLYTRSPPAYMMYPIVTQK